MRSRRPRRRSALGSSQQVTALHGQLLESRVLLAGVLGFNATLDASVIAPGAVTTLTFDITNDDPSETVADVEFTLTLPAGMTFAPTANGQSTIGGIVTAPDGGDTLTFTGGEVAALSSGTVSVDVTSNLAGIYTITTGDLTSTGGNSGPASVDLTVITAPTLSMSFADPVAPGSTTSLQFTLTLGENAPAQATDVAFTVDLDSALAGLTAVGLPQSDICGEGSLLTGTSVITLTGGTLLPGEMYTFTVFVQVPQGGAARQRERGFERCQRHHGGNGRHSIGNE